MEKEIVKIEKSNASSKTNDLFGILKLDRDAIGRVAKLEGMKPGAIMMIVGGLIYGIGASIGLGLTEMITLIGPDGNEEVLARIDTGATKSSIDVSLASKLKLGPIVDSKLIKSAHGTKGRPILKAELKIKKKKFF